MSLRVSNAQLLANPSKVLYDASVRIYAARTQILESLVGQEVVASVDGDHVEGRVAKVRGDRVYLQPSNPVRDGKERAVRASDIVLPLA